jgi:hypothetical protein
MPSIPEQSVSGPGPAGAQFHCAAMAPQTRNQVIYDWLDATL